MSKENVLKLRWLEYHAALTIPPVVAVIGLVSAALITAIVRGLERAAELGGPIAPSVWVFHRSGRWRKAARNLARSLRPPTGAERRRVIGGAVRLSVPAPSSRGQWRERASKLAAGGSPPFAAIYHSATGKLQELRADIDALAPMMDDRTMIVFCFLNKCGPLAAFELYRRRLGWNGVEVVPGLGVLRPAPYSKRPRET